MMKTEKYIWLQKHLKHLATTRLVNYSIITEESGLIENKYKEEELNSDYEQDKTTENLEESKN